MHFGLCTGPCTCVCHESELRFGMWTTLGLVEPLNVHAGAMVCYGPPDGHQGRAMPGHRHRLCRAPIPAAYMVALALGILVEALTDTPREEARFTCHLFAAVGLLVMAPEAVTLDFTTLCAFVILMRALYDVSARYAHSVELVCGWVTVMAIGCALTTSNG